MNILKISMAISLVGIIVLLILANNIEPKLTKIKDITIKDLNRKVKIQGKIINIKTYDTKNSETFQVLTISDETASIKIILNKNLKDQNLSIEQLMIIGRVTTYKNNLQIQAEKIIIFMLNLPISMF